MESSLEAAVFVDAYLQIKISHLIAAFRCIRDVVLPSLVTALDRLQAATLPLYFSSGSVILWSFTKHPTIIQQA